MCLSFRPHLLSRAGPIFDVIAADDLAISNRMDIDRRHMKGFSVRHKPDDRRNRSTGSLRSYDRLITGNKNFFDLPFQIGDSISERLEFLHHKLPLGYASLLSGARDPIRTERTIHQRGNVFCRWLVQCLIEWCEDFSGDKVKFGVWEVRSDQAASGC